MRRDGVAMASRWRRDGVATHLDAKKTREIPGRRAGENPPARPGKILPGTAVLGGGVFHHGGRNADDRQFFFWRFCRQEKKKRFGQVKWAKW